jgi:hypothetical protein
MRTDNRHPLGLILLKRFKKIPSMAFRLTVDGISVDLEFMLPLLVLPALF